MDKLDVRIIREYLQGEPLLSIWPSRASSRPPIRLLAKKLGTSESAVRSRVQRLSNLVSLSEGTLIVNPALLGESIGALLFDVSEGLPKEKVLKELKLIEGMFIMVDYESRHVVTVFFYSDKPSLKKKVDLIAAISGCKNRKTFANFVFPRCNLQLSRTDLQIIASRIKDMSKSNQGIAGELGLSSRTVKRRLTRMIDGGAFTPIASMDVTALKDCVYCDLVVTFKNAESRGDTEAGILPLVDDYLTFFGRFDSLTELNMIVPSIPIGEKLRDQIGGLANVKTARIEFIDDRIELYDVMLEKVNHQLVLAGT